MVDSVSDGVHRSIDTERQLRHITFSMTVIVDLSRRGVALIEHMSLEVCVVMDELCPGVSTTSWNSERPGAVLSERV